MALIKLGRIVPDPWVRVGDAGALPDDGRPALITLTRWQDEREILARRNGRLGVLLRPDQPPALIADDLDRFALVALEFPKFSDGRGYSHARLLRRRHGYTGELRAVGEVLRDQLGFLQRCGFDAFEMKDADAATAGDSLGAIAVWYQAAADQRSPAAILRHAAPQPNRAGDRAS